MIVSMSTIDKLIVRMTLPEKLGQMTMTAASYAVTGPVIAGDSTDSIRNGTLGNLLNLVGAAETREVQRIAVEESRLGIPLLIGFAVLAVTTGGGAAAGPPFPLAVGLGAD